jgi:uncharacterized protein (DUF1800 family)
MRRWCRSPPARHKRQNRDDLFRAGRPFGSGDLNGILGYLASHPNTAPFISKQLIQHLVKSNPSPQYVQRVSTAFTQSNGDMPTVITAILLDTEARANDAGGNDQPTDGHFQEPALLIPAVVRAFAGTDDDDELLSLYAREHGAGCVQCPQRVQLLLARICGGRHGRPAGSGISDRQSERRCAP